MIDVRDLIERVGPPLLRAVCLPRTVKHVGDVVIAEPGQVPELAEGDLVLGVATVDSDQAINLAHACRRQGAAALLVKPPVTGDAGLIATAESADLALIEVSRDTAWAQLVWLVRAALSGITESVEPTGPGDLFRLADAVADVVDAPVTIEDAHSQVLAYSARQDLTDSARVSTIMGRKQPEDVLAKFRARGTFRKLSKASSAVYVPAQQDGTLPRLVVPIRMGGELLGSMWAVVPGEVSEERATAFADTAALVALRLLRWRAVADVERQRSAELVRLILEGADGWHAAASEVGLSDDPHRVVAIDVTGSEESSEGLRLATWERIRRGVGPRPLVAELGGVLYAVVSDRSRGWATLRDSLSAPDAAYRWVAVGTPVEPAALPESRRQADELLGLLRAGILAEGVAVYEELWHLVVLNRMAGSATAAGVDSLGPVPALRGHDAAYGTEYLNTLYAWLRYPGDPRRASQELRVHPNTFRYRMKRLTEIVDVDLDNTDVRCALLVQLLADRWGRRT